jgi:hypothetical protein
MVEDRRWWYQPVNTVRIAVAYGLLLGLYAQASIGGGDGCLAPAVLFASPLGMFGPPGFMFGPPLFYYWIGKSLSSGSSSLRVPALLVTGYVTAIALWLTPWFGDWSKTIRILSSNEGGSVWFGGSLYLFGQIWLWRCWYKNRSTRNGVDTCRGR